MKNIRNDTYNRKNTQITLNIIYKQNELVIVRDTIY